MTPTKHDLLVVLRTHIGRENGCKVSDLAYHVRTNERTVRKLVSELRADGIAVCGHPATGYFIARTAEDLEETCGFLRSRAMHSLTLESKLRKIPLPDLIGQLHLRT
ncbi:MAG: hypothetical protein GC151_13740 [Betaproteobacteria bacterium]|nr:hypothetical protein [Betaproteobacteria bacterium]